MKKISTGSLALIVNVVRTSGAPIDKAKVVVKWESGSELDLDSDDSSVAAHILEQGGFPNTQEAETDSSGQAVFGVPSGLHSKGMVQVTKAHHGAVAAQGADFRSGTVEVPIELALNLLLVPGQRPTKEVRWGQARIIHLRHKGRKQVGLEVSLVEGGTLGVEHANVRTRRLSNVLPELPADAGPDAPQTLSQTDEELLYHIAHGDVALTRTTDFEFKHDESLEDCVPGRCGIVPKEAVPSDTDPNFGPLEQEFAYIPKITARNGIVGGLRMLGLASVGDPYKVGPSQFRYANGYMIHQNPRNVVGVIRLAKKLLSQHKVRVILSTGFIRNYSLKDLQISSESMSTVPPDWKKLKRDAHGRGRAVDIAGLMLDAPEELHSRTSFWPRKDDPQDATYSDPTAILPGLRNKTYVSERDFLVRPHWGLMPMLVKDLKGVKQRVDGQQSTWVERQFADAFKTKTPSKGAIFYRLEELDQAINPEEPGKIPKKMLAHEHTPLHYEMARDLFRFVYQYFAAEYSHRDNLLGNLQFLDDEKVPPPIGLNAAKVDDQVGAPSTIGSIGGFVLHPDVPSAGTRRYHQDHIHANLGHNGPQKSDGEQWTEDSSKLAERSGYEQ